MRRFLAQILTITILVLSGTPFSRAQAPAPYLVAATFYISVDDWADMWLNGIPVIDSVPYTSVQKGIYINHCEPQHLCYFQRENILSILVTENTQTFKPGQDSAGIAYVLKLRYSDGTAMTLSSNDVDQHVSFYNPDRYSGDLRGWHNKVYNDAAWPKAQSIGTLVPYLATLSDPETKQEIQFLSASGITAQAKYPGERHLFRRKFSLNIDTSRCGTPTPGAKIEPVFLSQTEGPRHAVLTPTPTVVPRPTATPVPTRTPTPVPTPAVVMRPKPLPIRTFYRTATPVPIVRRRVLPTFTPTPTFFFVPREIAEPKEEKAPPPVVVVQVPTVTPIPKPEPVASQAETIVFGESPANIYLGFADGPGVYRLEVFDWTGKKLKDLFEKKVVAQRDVWVEWDGKDGEGRDAPPGWYYVNFSKDGKILKRIFVGRTKSGP